MSLPADKPPLPETSGKREFRVALASAGVAFLPIAFVWLYKTIFHPRPFWAFYYDPETFYFYGGASLLRHAAPRNLDNPGMPLHALSALVLSITGTDPLLFDRFRSVAYAIAAAMTFAAMALLSYTLLAGLSWTLRVVCLWTFFLCPQSLEYTSVWSPEQFYLPFGALVLASASNCLTKGATAKRCLYAGISLGLAVALKFTFLAWAPALLLALLLTPPTGRNSVRALAFLGGSTIGFLLGTGFLVARYARMLTWLWELATHSGEYGRGVADAPAAGEIFASLLVALSSAKLWHLWLLFLGLVAVCGLWRSRRLGDRDAWGECILLFFLCATLATYAMGLRHLALRYLLPSGVAAVALAALALRTLARSAWARAGAVVFLAAGVLLGKHIVRDLHSHDRRIEEWRSTRQAIERQVEAHSPPGRPAVTIYAFGAPLPSLALRYSADHPEDYAAISRVYPNEGHLNWANRIVLPTGASGWDLAVLTEQAHATFPEPVGPVLASVGPFVIVPRPSVRNCCTPTRR